MAVHEFHVAESYVFLSWLSHDALSNPQLPTTHRVFTRVESNAAQISMFKDNSDV